MNRLIHISHEGDLYEVSLRGFIIARISRYWGGSSMRQDAQYDDVPTAVQDKILDKISEIILEDQ